MEIVLDVWEEIGDILTPIILAISLFLAIYTSQKFKIKRNELNTETAIAERNVLAKYLEISALKVLLPTFVIDALRKQDLSLELGIALIIGAFIPFVTYGGSWMYNKVFGRFQWLQLRFAEEFHFMVSTFGGGNRGVILISILFLSHPDRDAYLTMFITIDLGYFLAFLTFFTMLLKNKFGGEGSDSLFDKLRGNYALISFSLAIIFVLLNLLGLVEWVKVILSDTVEQRKIVFLILVFLAILLRVKVRPDQLQYWFSTFVATITIRGLLIFGVLTLMPLGVINSVILASISVLLLMPFSSIFPSIFNQTNAAKESIEYVSTMVLAAYLGYIVVLITTILIVVVSHFM